VLEYWSIGVVHRCRITPFYVWHCMALKNYRPLTPTLRFKSPPGFTEITEWRPANRAVSAVPWFGFATAAEESGLYNSKLCQTAVSVAAIDPFGPFDFAQGKTFA
jgi:hypothetical protein